MRAGDVELERLLLLRVTPTHPHPLRVLLHTVSTSGLLLPHVNMRLVEKAVEMRRRALRS